MNITGKLCFVLAFITTILFVGNHIYDAYQFEQTKKKDSPTHIEYVIEEYDDGKWVEQERWIEYLYDDHKRIYSTE